MGRAGEYVRAMVAAPEPIAWPLICTCQGSVVDGTFQLQPPVIIFDGWHRGSAWILQGQAGRVYPIRASLILTEKSPPPSCRAAKESA